MENLEFVAGYLKLKVFPDFGYCDRNRGILSSFKSVLVLVVVYKVDKHDVFRKREATSGFRKREAKYEHFLIIKWSSPYAGHTRR